MDYAILEQTIADWAASQALIRAVVVVGSRARQAPAADAWSDLDLMLFTTAPNVYVADTAWLHTFGEVWVHLLNETGAGQPEWLVLYAGGFKVDFFLATLTADLEQMLFGDLYGMVTERGYRVLLNKDGSTQMQRPYQPPPASSPPTAEMFTAVTQTFWLYAYRSYAMLQRGELWRAQDVMQRKLRHALIQMLAWHAQASQGAKVDTWFDGRFLAQWADPQALDILPQTFAVYDAVDLQRALNALIDLFSRLTEETAGHWQFAYPSDGVEKLQIWLALG